MSKLILPTQKGIELFPDTIIAPPIVRWVGIDPRSPDSETLAAKYDSLIKAFYVQQAQNHALSTNDQTRAYRRLDENISVRYLNQGGKEYITVDATPIKAQPVKQEVRIPAPDQPCWFPVASPGMLFTEQYAPTADIVCYEDADVWPEPVVPYELDFAFQLYGYKVTSIGFPSSCGYVVCNNLSGSASAPRIDKPSDLYFGSQRQLSWPATYPGLIDPMIPVICPYYAAYQTYYGGSVTMRKGAVAGRRFMSVTWQDMRPSSSGYAYDQPYPTATFELVIIEPRSRATRSACPALIGFTYKQIDWEFGFPGPPEPGYPGLPPYVGFAQNGQYSYGKLSNAQIGGISSTVANKQIWFRVDGGLPTPLSAETNWVPYAA